MKCDQCHDEAAYGRLCRRHHLRIVRPAPGPRRRHAAGGTPAIDRLLARVEVAGECWLWAGSVNRKGYAEIRGDDGRMAKGHRVAYAALVGPIPEGLQVDHCCHNRDLTCPGGVICQHRRCVNPAHLEAVTNALNAQRGASRRLKVA